MLFGRDCRQEEGKTDGESVATLLASRDCQQEEGKTSDKELAKLLLSFCNQSLVADRGGGSRGRTGDIQLAKLALYQLSYAPVTGSGISSD